MLRPETPFARLQRREMALPEIIVWEQLRGKKLGAKFRRQHPIGPYVVDFFCSAARLVVGVDGEAHERGDRPERDRRRDQFLTENGYRVLRIGAADILQDIEAVHASIALLVAAPLHHAAHGPPPRSGED